MAISKTNTGSQWHIWQGTAEEVVNSLMLSGVGTANVSGFSGPNDAGSYAVLMNATF